MSAQKYSPKPTAKKSLAALPNTNELQQILRCYIVQSKGRANKQLLSKFEQDFMDKYPHSYSHNPRKFFVKLATLLNVKVDIYKRTHKGQAEAIVKQRYGNVNHTTLPLILEANGTFSLKRNLCPLICSRCSQTFSAHPHLSRHISNRVCQIPFEPKTEYSPGGFMSGYARLIWTRLGMLGITVTSVQRNPNYVICYDYESMSSVHETPVKLGESTILTDNQIPLSWAVNSNIPGTEAKFFSHYDPEVLVREFWEHCNCLSEIAFKKLLPRYRNIFKRLNKLIDSLNPEDETKRGSEGYYRNQIISLKQDLLRFIKQTPLIAFYGAKFDVVLIMKWLAKYLLENGEPKIIKKNLGYMCISTPKLRYFSE